MKRISLAVLAALVFVGWGGVSKADAVVRPGAPKVISLGTTSGVCAEESNFLPYYQDMCVAQGGTNAWFGYLYSVPSIYGPVCVWHVSCAITVQ